MTTPIFKLYPSAPTESIKNDDLELRLEVKLNDVNSFSKNSISNIKEMITYVKDKSCISEIIYRNYETLTSLLESVDAVDFIGSTTTSVTLSVTGIGLIVVLISNG